MPLPVDAQITPKDVLEMELRQIVIVTGERVFDKINNGQMEDTEIVYLKGFFTGIPRSGLYDWALANGLP